MFRELALPVSTCLARVAELALRAVSLLCHTAQKAVQKKLLIAKFNKFGQPDCLYMFQRRVCQDGVQHRALPFLLFEMEAWVFGRLCDQAFPILSQQFEEVSEFR